MFGCFLYIGYNKHFIKRKNVETEKIKQAKTKQKISFFTLRGHFVLMQDTTNQNIIKVLMAFFSAKHIYRDFLNGKYVFVCKTAIICAMLRRLGILLLL